MTVPRALARLQFHPEFTLDDAAARVPYYANLGVSHLYASPLTSAREGSTHGYDVIDHQRINPALGGEPALERLVARLREHDMGLILDIVPNHMATQADNAWWWSVWAQGPASPYAHYFDINWHSLDPALNGKILAPFLGVAYGQALADGEIVLAYDTQRTAYVIRAHGNPYPIAAGTLEGAGDSADDAQAALIARYDPATEAGRAKLHELLEKQFYRLAWWRCAPEEINWRRFFEVSELVGVCVEHDDVFDAVHAKTLDLYAKGLIDGLRVDHVDGLADPIAYCTRLRDAMQARRAERPGKLAAMEPYLVIEKILAHDEVLDARWDTHGTTGYDFMSQVTAVLHDPTAEVALTDLWKSASGETRNADEVLLDARQLMLSRHFPVERNACVEALHDVAASDPLTRDISRQAIGRSLDIFLTLFPAYRTYADGRGRSDQDAPRFEATLARARTEIEQECDGDDLPVLDALDKWLGGEAPNDFPAAQRDLRLNAIRRFQQLTPPLAAKSLEDTTFYQYGRLLSNNDVGGEPQLFAATPETFHAQNLWRAAHLPHAMLTTATHDHKRGEDVRARLAVLSEVPDLWRATVERIQRLERDAVDALVPSGRDRYMLWQTIVGAWPLDLALHDADGLNELTDRLLAWQTKSVREAKRKTSWIAPREDYEAACESYLKALLHPDSERLEALSTLAKTISAAGAINGLTQTVIRLTAPGVPDTYQGTEFWDFSLVDPDNRRPVDFEAREHALGTELMRSGRAPTAAGSTADDETGQPSPATQALVTAWHDGHLKQAVIRRVLHLRRDHPALFAHGEYVPLKVEGVREANIVAYLRRLENDWAITIVPRLVADGIDHDAASPPVPLIDPGFWGDTRVILPANVGAKLGRDVIANVDRHVPADGVLLVSRALADLPVAVLISQ